MSEDFLYTETQKDRGSWVQLVVILATFGTIGLFAWALVQQIGFGIPWGTKPVSDPVLIVLAVVFSLLMVGVMCLVLPMRMEIRITAASLQYGLFPLHRKLKTIDRSEIREARAVPINPMKDFGGYGIKYGRLGKGVLMNVTQGVQLTFNKGPGLFLGSANPGEVVRILGLADH